jgi:hypothetical protein
MQQFRQILSKSSFSYRIWPAAVNRLAGGTAMPGRTPSKCKAAIFLVIERLSWLLMRFFFKIHLSDRTFQE